jgi:hypothetical protein
MKKRQNVTLSIIVLLSLSFADTVAVSQTKPNIASPPKKSPSVAVRTVPAIKCTDPDSMVACKSFKQLVDARDKGLLDSLTGNKDSRDKHFAYVCLPPKEDTFKVVEFDEPSPEEYRPYSPPVAGMKLVALMQENEAFPYKEGMPVTQHLDVREKWYEDHDDFSSYEFGWIYVDSWESGILTDYVSDIGKWKRPLPQGHSPSVEDVFFESAHQWLAKFNEADANQFAAVDDRKRPRISVGDTEIYVRYSYKNKHDDYTDYTLTIQRSTGRFTESFEATGLDPSEDSGTCMIFKQ